MIPAALAGIGTYYLWTAWAMGWNGLGIGPGPKPDTARRPAPVRRWLNEAGLGGVRPSDFVFATGAFGVLGGLVALTVFGAAAPAGLVSIGAAAVPVLTHRRRREDRRVAARDAWPRIIEEVRILTGAAGRSVPHALFEAGRRAPVELQPAFAASYREWLLTTDFDRSLAVLKDLLAEPGADAICEVLLVAHEVGGGDLDRRLLTLARERSDEIEARRAARSDQAGVRFARRFVLLVPAGMAAAGLTIGPGREAYRQPAGQLSVVVGVALIGVCWLWTSLLMRVPDTRRVLVR